MAEGPSWNPRLCFPLLWGWQLRSLASVLWALPGLPRARLQLPQGPPQDASLDLKQDTGAGGALRRDQGQEMLLLLQRQLCDLERCGPECSCFHGDITPGVGPRLSTLGLMNMHSPYCRKGDLGSPCFSTP